MAEVKVVVKGQPMDLVAYLARITRLAEVYGVTIEQDLRGSELCPQKSE